MKKIVTMIFLIISFLSSGCRTSGKGNLKSNPLKLEIGRPDSCRNTFYADGCIAGDSNSKCGGVCSPANSCVTAEGEQAFLSKLEKGSNQQFSCPRYMMFSPEMTAAEKDDNNSQFTFGVAGHDPDIEGLDKGLDSTCCHCYQLRFVGFWRGNHESIVDPGDIPLPKDMVVQSFNTQAGGPKAFDLYMGVGGLGAHNSCTNDPDFFKGRVSSDGVSKVDFMYRKYPKFNDYFKGGVRASNLSSCVGSDNKISKEKLNSSACREAIKKQCELVEGYSDKVTKETVQSCIKASQLKSFYHENWAVEVRKVRCPDKLTQVTGCKPANDKHLPSHTSVGGTFRKGYHTTTMQDCCMPTCAWKENVKIETVDGYNSFYSCNQRGEALVEDFNPVEPTTEKNSDVEVEVEVDIVKSDEDKVDDKCTALIKNRIDELGGWKEWMDGQSFFMPCKEYYKKEDKVDAECTALIKNRIDELGGWKEWMDGQSFFMPCKEYYKNP